MCFGNERVILHTIGIAEYLFIQHLYSAYFTNKYALMR